MALLIFGAVVGGTVALGLFAGPSVEGPKYESPQDKTYDSHGRIGHELGQPGSPYEQRVRNTADLAAGECRTPDDGDCD